MDEKGNHSGGPFIIHVNPKMRITDVRKVIRVSVFILFSGVSSSFIRMKYFFAPEGYRGDSSCTSEALICREAPE